jgi:hypothetical protein
MRPGSWRVERLIRDGKAPGLPFLITIQSEDGHSLVLRSSRPWPPPRGNSFVKRHDRRPTDDHELIEECHVLDVHKVAGEKAVTLHVLLDRAQRKRCSFLFLKKDGEEVAYFRTQGGIEAHRSRSYLQPTALRVAHEIVIDSRERYPWALDAERVVRGPLPAGDYALRIDEQLVAVVERKTFENMLANLGQLEAYHGHLLELSAFPAAALVIEAQYGDFANPKKTRPAAAARCLRALADLEARHPNLKLVFAGNRKQAALWTAQFFAAVAARHRSGDTSVVQPQLLDARGRTHGGGAAVRLREAILTQLPESFTTAAAAALAPALSAAQVAACLRALRSEGRVTSHGHGRGARWHRVPTGGG